MKKISKFTMILLVLSIVLTMFAGAALADVIAEDGSTNIRSRPSLSGKDLGTLPKGKSATYLDETELDDRGVAWYYISYKDTTGWVSSMYTYRDDIDSYNSVHGSLWTTGDAHIRKSPSLSGSIIETVGKGERVNYLDETSTDDRGVVWYYVSWDTTTGWISSRYLSWKYGGASIDSSSGSSGSGSTSYGTVKGTDGSSNIRTEPSLYGEDIGTLPKGKSAKYLGQTEWDDRDIAWYKISYNGTVGWVSSMYTTLYD